VAAIEVTQGLSNERVSARLAQFRLQCLHQRNQHLSLDLGLLDDGYGHARPLVVLTLWTPLTAPYCLASPRPRRHRPRRRARGISPTSAPCLAACRSTPRRSRARPA